MMENKLEELSQKLGIATSFSAQGIANQKVSDELLKFFCAQFGVDVSSDQKIKALKIWKRS